MKYILTGSAGHISSLLAIHLLEAGHKVTVVGRNKEHLQSLVDAGVDYALGSVQDAEFLKQAFKGHDAVYTMCPHSLEVSDVMGYYEMLGSNYAEAIKVNNIKYVVNLSSIGAHLAIGAGPISGLHRVEKELNSLPDVNIRHLRPAYFYYNFYDSIGMIKEMGIIGGDFSIPPNQFPLVHHADIAVAAAEELMNLVFTGSSVRYITSDVSGTDEVASVLGNVIGKPDLHWVKFSHEQALEGMMQGGLPKELAQAFVEMSTALDDGIVMEDYLVNPPKEFGSVKLEDFAREFAHAYQAGSQ